MEKKQFKSYSVTITENETLFHIWESTDGRGSSIFYDDRERYKILFVSSNYTQHEAERLFTDRFTGELFQNTGQANHINGPFSLFISDKDSGETAVISDRIGVMPVYYNSTIGKKGTVVFSPLISLISKQAEIPVELQSEGMLAHFGFGYHVEPHPFLYKGMEKLEPAVRLILSGTKITSSVKYWHSQTGDQELHSDDLNAIVDALQKNINRQENLFVGLTAGKDSLVLASLLSGRVKNIKSGSFGTPYSSDVKQGQRIAEDLGFDHTFYKLTGKEEFIHIAEHISFFSSGMGTLSLVDFVGMCLKKDIDQSAFVMGEGGECVRDFFSYQSRDGSKPLDRYITPFDLINSVFKNLEFKTAEEYRHYLFGEQLPEISDDFLISFYRRSRMPGNFSLRTGMLLPVINKCTPFLDNLFIDKAYPLEKVNFSGSELHRRILKTKDPTLLHYFENPDREDINCQNWGNRIPREIGPLLRQKLEQNGEILNDHFNLDEMMKICDRSIDNPGRNIYFIFRIVSLAMFLETGDLLLEKKISKTTKILQIR